jgi:Ca2+-transporting ATPase
LQDESSLTGENRPVEKTGEGLALGTAPPLTQQHNIVFAGTLINAGRGRCCVVAVGDATEFGKIASELCEVTQRKSPLQVKIDELGQRLATLSSIAIAIIALIGWMMGRPFLETVTVAVSLAVAAIPEGLPICVTVTLALGVLRMASHNAIVKKLPVVESLGCATVVASDKTGTLTQNEMTVRAAFVLAFPDTKFGFTGVGYQPSSGQLIYLNDDLSVSEHGSGKSSRAIPIDSEEMTALGALLHTACLCNNANLIQSVDSSVAEGHTGGDLSGQPTELALLAAAAKAGIVDPRSQYHRLQEIPFTSERKRMEVRARPVGGVHVCEAFTKAVEGQSSIFKARRMSVDGSLHFVKGMPEKVLGESESYVLPSGATAPLLEDERAKVLSQSRKMAASGLRVLALAFGEKLGHLTFAGVVGMEDPPRVGVVESVRQLRRSGVKVMMVTGDSKETALAIAQRCGILGDNYEGEGDHDLLLSPSGSGDLESGVSQAMSGTEIDAIPPQSLPDSIVGIRVFYRVVPRHKLALVRAMQALGEIVAMTGDGVNDAVVSGA